MAFRFENLEIWQHAAEMAMPLCDIADRLELRKLFRFAEQLRGAALSMSNNIAEGSGSTSNREFKHFLNIARRSTFENASMLLVLQRRGVVTPAETEALLPELDRLCRMITAFSRSLNDDDHPDGNKRT